MRVRGFSGGVSLLVLGFEFEYANLSEDELEQLPGLKTYSGNVLVQTPTSMQLYATIGGGGYQERLAAARGNAVGVNIGGGVKIPLLGPLRVRADYRIFQLRGIAAAHDLSALLCGREYALFLDGSEPGFF